jgi:hypothetical protein
MWHHSCHFHASRHPIPQWFLQHLNSYLFAALNVSGAVFHSFDRIFIHEVHCDVASESAVAALAVVKK